MKNTLNKKEINTMKDNKKKLILILKLILYIPLTLGMLFVLFVLFIAGKYD